MYIVGITPLILRIKLAKLLFSTNYIESQQNYVAGDLNLII